jgi:hypothetical protein
VAFEDVPKPHHVSGCPCCTSEGEFDVLLAKPIRKISPDELTRYASKALTTVGTAEDIHYFPPRILEICATESGWWPDSPIVFGKMQMAGWKNWPEKQVSAIREYVWEAFLRLLEREESSSEIDDWICGLGKAEEDLSPYLAELERQPSKLVAYYEQNSQSLLKGRLSNSFWDEATSARQVVVNWFQSKKVMEIISGAYGTK